MLLYILSLTVLINAKETVKRKRTDHSRKENIQNRIGAYTIGRDKILKYE